MLFMPSEEMYYTSAYRRLPSGELETEVFLNQPDEVALDDVKRKDRIVGGIMVSYSKDEAIGVIRPANILMMFLEKDSDGWAIRSTEATGIRVYKSMSLLDATVSDYGSLPTLEEGLEGLNLCLGSMMPNKDSITALTPAEGRSVIIHRDLYCAVRAFETAGIPLPFKLDLSEPLASPR